MAKKAVKRKAGRPRTTPDDAVYFRFWLPAEMVSRLDDSGPCRQKTIQRIVERHFAVLDSDSITPSDDFLENEL